MTGIWRIRAAILTLAGALGVHQGRYLFATPEHEHELAGVHGYLPWLTPLAGALVFLAVVQLLALLGREPRSAHAQLPHWPALWLAATGSLLSVFVGQECVETVLADGRLPLLVDVFGAGGWTAIPVAIVVGAVIALLLKGAARAVRWALTRSRRSRPRRALPRRGFPQLPVLAPRRSVLARRLAGRGPPALS